MFKLSRQWGYAITGPLSVLLFVSLCSSVLGNEAAEARREVLQHSYGTYAGNLRAPDGHMDCDRLITELTEIHANTYNWLIAHGDTDWEDLHAFLPLAKASNIRVWVTVLPPSESPPRTKYYSEPFQLDFEKWASELASLSAREPALVAWSVDDFAYNLTTFTPAEMRKIIAAQRDQNPKFAFVPCVYYKHATPGFAATYGQFFDGILFPYRSESTTPGFTDAAQVVPEVRTLQERFGRGFPIVVDIYATRHSRLGASTPAYVEQVMKLAHPVAEGVHIYRHQNKRDPNEREKYDLIERVMSSWDEPTTPAPTNR
jgi:1,2-phenylacetyl-CoA epoxidase PaaB subunit